MVWEWTGSTRKTSKTQGPFSNLKLIKVHLAASQDWVFALVGLLCLMHLVSSLEL